MDEYQVIARSHVFQGRTIPEYNIELNGEHLWRMSSAEKAQGWIAWHRERRALLDRSVPADTAEVGDIAWTGNWDGSRTPGLVQFVGQRQIVVTTSFWMVDGILVEHTEIWQRGPYGGLLASGPSLAVIIKHEQGWAALEQGAQEADKWA